MDFALRCAFAHGTGAIRTHLDSIGTQTAISWPVFAELREEWRGPHRAAGACRCSRSTSRCDERAEFRDDRARPTARHGGALGGVTFLGEAPDERTDRALDRDRRRPPTADGLDLDFHVDESGAPGGPHAWSASPTRCSGNRFAGKVLCGHCCSLVARMRRGELARVVAKVAEARLAVVSLPMCNMYLQDRAPGPHAALARRRAAARAEGGRRAGDGRERQHPRSVLRLWRPRHARGVPRGDAHPAPRPCRARTGRARSPRRPPTSWASTGTAASRPATPPISSSLRARTLTELLAPAADRPHRAGRRTRRSTRRSPDYRELDEP